MAEIAELESIRTGIEELKEALKDIATSLRRLSKREGVFIYNSEDKAEFINDTS